MSTFFLAKAASAQASNSRSCVYRADSGRIAATLSCSCFSCSFCFFLRAVDERSIGFNGETMLEMGTPGGLPIGF
ncbi:hypothetical protein OIU78_026007 [Salix suchowensis]|nr:hypothetical protein OIU78_026007 [Salix suchowensis]